ncbi:hypothetical protein [Amycolatopsis anabasis]|uniref:hypothetical protein n=1 Tax=Amycolatopsis anabasis TaxID=1840409 RepID=UPI00131E0462|nr:hypothetical protein [Amycolatopsis anabasis]
MQAPPGLTARVFQYPSLSAPILGELANGTSVWIRCTAQGDVVQRPDGFTSSLWNRIDQGFVPDVAVDTGTNQATMPNC